MKRGGSALHIVVLLPTVLSWLLISLASAQAAQFSVGQYSVTVDPTNAYQFRGWGTSLAWWANAVGSSGNKGGGADIGTTDWSDTVRQSIENMLFDQPSDQHQPGQDWLGLTVARYNIGASPPTPAAYGQLDYNSFTSREVIPGGSGIRCPKLDRRAQVPSPQDTPDGPIQLEVDNRQLNVMMEVDHLLRAQKAPYLYEAFANSPPWWMTLSGCPTGFGTATGGGAGSDNLGGDSYKWTLRLPALIKPRSPIRR